ncbi:MAG: hypothetical protein KatS3mg111_3058 [Pirellulaceae bacterium]|nr:MAG: hypothetical protein KatS3mg111_3058 [Pirellulaceae bacterium]
MNSNVSVEVTSTASQSPAADACGSLPEPAISVPRRWRAEDVLLMAGLIGLSPLLVEQVRQLAIDRQYRWAPLALGLVAWQVWRHGKRDGAMVARRWRAALGVAVVTVALGVAAAAIVSPWLAQVSALGMFAAWALVRWRGNPWHQVVAWITLTAITLPTLGGAERWEFWLQRWGASAASAMLDAVGVPHALDGIVWELAAKRLLVDQVLTNSMGGLVVLLGIAAGMAVVGRVSLITAVLLMGSVPLWQWWGDVARLMVVSLGLEWLEVDLSHGGRLMVLHVGVMGLQCAALALTYVGLREVFKPFPIRTVTSGGWHTFFNRVACWPGADPADSGRRSRSSRTEHEARPAELPQAWRRGGFWASLVVATGVLIGGGWRLASDPTRARTLPHLQLDPSTAASVFTESRLPTPWSGMQRVDFRLIRHPVATLVHPGFAAGWTYRAEEFPVQVAVEFPFARYVPAEWALMGPGRTLVRRETQRVEPSPGTDGGEMLVDEVMWQDAVHGPTYLWYVSMDATGQDAWRVHAAERRGGAKLLGLVKLQPAVFRVQVVVTGERLSDAEAERYRTLVVDAAHAMVPYLRAATLAD